MRTKYTIKCETMNTATQAPAYKIYEGAIKDRMPNLQSDNLVPVSMHDVMLIRLDPKKFTEATGVIPWDIPFDTGDGAARHSDGRLTIAWDVPQFRLLTPDTELNCGDLRLDDGAYSALRGPGFSAREVRKYAKKEMTVDDVKKNPIWL